MAQAVPPRQAQPGDFLVVVRKSSPSNPYPIFSIQEKPDR